MTTDTTSTSVSKTEEVVLLEKRLWCYVQRPAVYEIAPHDCGHDDAQWSEYEGRLWCAHCAVDFIPAHAGIFSGPISTKLASMMGICFDRVNIATGKIDRFDTETACYASDPAETEVPA